MAKRRSVADTYVSIIPETSRVAAAIAQAFRSVDREAREAGRRWAPRDRRRAGQLAQTRTRTALRQLP